MEKEDAPVVKLDLELTGVEEASRLVSDIRDRLKGVGELLEQLAELEIGAEARPRAGTSGRRPGSASRGDGE